MPLTPTILAHHTSVGMLSLLAQLQVFRNIKDFGVRVDGKTDDRAAVMYAIQACLKGVWGCSPADSRCFGANEDDYHQRRDLWRVQIRRHRTEYRQRRG